MYEKSIELLNQTIGDELTAVHQYMYFHFHCEDQGYELLSSLFKRIALVEMQHVERCAERILFLKGDVEMALSRPVKKIHDVKEMLEESRKIEQDSIIKYNKFANECSAHTDSGSKNVFESLVSEEELHYDDYDLEMDKINKFGEHYLALQSIESSKGEPVQA
ncbi:MAG: bacterioferritin [Anaerolineaceae bacterium]|nr:bacterioferritin [Anaerolineaceae bacterium]